MRISSTCSAWYDPPGTVHDGEPVDEVADLMKKEKFACVGLRALRGIPAEYKGPRPASRPESSDALSSSVEAIAKAFLPSHGRLGCALGHDEAAPHHANRRAGSGAR